MTMNIRRVQLIVTAGPTREAIDPVRFLSNPSTGKMGFAVAKAGVRKGFDVTLITGPVSLKTPNKVNRVDVVSARDMLRAVEDALLKAKESGGECIFVSTAAIADFRPVEAAKKKIKKSSSQMVLKLVKNPDILKTVCAKRAKGVFSKNLKLVGFAAETGSPIEEGFRKCREKGLEFIVANDVTKPGCGFATDTNQAYIIKKDGLIFKTPLVTKERLAKIILDNAL